MNKLQCDLQATKYDLIEEVKEKAPASVKNALINAIRKMDIIRMYRKHVEDNYSGMESSVIEYLRQIKPFETWEQEDVDWLLRDIVLEVILYD